MRPALFLCRRLRFSTSNSLAANFNVTTNTVNNADTNTPLTKTFRGLSARPLLLLQHKYATGLLFRHPFLATRFYSTASAPSPAIPISPPAPEPISLSPSPPDTMNDNPTAARPKRKEPPQDIDGRRPKHHRANNGSLSAGDNTPDRPEDFEADYEELDDLRVSAALQTGQDTPEWQATIQSVVKNVVSIRFCQTCSFDTDPALTSEATGFVVDAERG